MSSDASTLPLQDTPAGSRWAGLKRRLLRGRAGVIARPAERAWIGVACLLVILACSAFVVAPLKHQPIPHSGKMAILGFTVNAAWGFGTALFYRLFSRR